MFEAAPAMFVSVKFAEVPTPVAEAVTVYVPGTVLAVKTPDVAMPDRLVVALFTLPAKVPVALMPGAVKVTVTPLTGLLEESFTVACSCVANAVFTVALCGVPAVAVMLAGMPAPPVPPAALKAARIAPQLLETLRVAV